MSANSNGNPADLAPSEEELGSDLVWGVRNIGAAINRNPRQTFHLCATGQLPARLIGRRWVTSRSALRKFLSVSSSSREKHKIAAAPRRGTGRSISARVRAKLSMRTQNRPSTAQEQPAVESGQTFGGWTALGLDLGGKWVLCRCACSAVRQVALAALNSVESLGCGCSSTPRPRTVAAASLSAGIAAEFSVARGRHRGRL